MADCQKLSYRLLEYLDKELDSQSMVDIKNHVEACRECYDVAEFETLLRDHMKKKTNHCCPEKVKKKIQELIKLF